MAKLFIFGIGGTGSRVIKSLAMLLAAGLKPTNEFEIVPIIIDPHKDNEDLKRTIVVLDLYQNITNEAGLGNGFFGTKISTLESLDTTEKLSGTYTFNLKKVANTKFKDYFSYNSLGPENKAFADLVFSGKSIGSDNTAIDLLDLPMNIGFVGNPNIGSVVLNQFADSEEFRKFATYFSADDRVFIISSIFGGTGAAGFPIVLKNIRKPEKGIANAGFLTNSSVGALTVMPYFNIDGDENSAIKKSDFIEKTKAALGYYQQNVNPALNAMYYLGDDFGGGKPYKNDPGSGGQKNNAHFVELAGALAIIDFMNTPASQLKTEGGIPRNPLAKEYSIKTDNASLMFKDLNDKSNTQLSKSLTQFTLLKKYVDVQFAHTIGKKVWSTDLPAIDQSFIDDIFMNSNLKGFLDHYSEWLNEMLRNSRGFSPFNLQADLHKLVNGKDAKKGFIGFGKMSYDRFDTELAKEVKKTSYTSAEQKMLHLFFSTTKNIVSDRYFKK